MSSIVHKLEPITLVGAGPLSESDLMQSLALAPHLVAADGGASHCLSYDLIPEAVIGDMDSFEALEAQGVPATRLHPVAEQDSTDFDKALRHTVAPVVLAVGFTGGRLDHELACFNGLVRHAHQPCILIGDVDVICLAPPQLRLTVAAGTRVSLFPMAAVTGRSEGLQWPIEGIAFAPDGSIGTSNAATGPVSMAFDAPGMLLILPKRVLPELLTQLQQAPATWPVP
ncbi:MULTISPECIES: thiamine diphosphokinase [unclassified Shimia]|uniref:thiamine diphosphokinase n=1 Tax=unclassified Shimia TaxID=2630038 RepID=UPI003102179D